MIGMYIQSMLDEEAIKPSIANDIEKLPYFKLTYNVTCPSHATRW